MTTILISKDKNQISGFRNRFKELQKNNDSCDTQIICKDGKLYAHLVVIHAGSRFLDGLMNLEWSAGSKIIFFPHIKKKYIEYVLDIIYLGRTSVANKHVGKVKAAAKEFHVDLREFDPNELAAPDSQTNDSTEFSMVFREENEVILPDANNAQVRRVNNLPQLPENPPEPDTQPELSSISLVLEDESTDGVNKDSANDSMGVSVAFKQENEMLPNASNAQADRVDSMHQSAENKPVPDTQLESSSISFVLKDESIDGLKQEWAQADRVDSMHQSVENKPVPDTQLESNSISFVLMDELTDGVKEESAQAERVDYIHQSPENQPEPDTKLELSPKSLVLKSESTDEVKLELNENNARDSRTASPVVKVLSESAAIHLLSTSRNVQLSLVDIIPDDEELASSDDSMPPLTICSNDSEVGNDLGSCIETSEDRGTYSQGSVVLIEEDISVIDITDSMPFQVETSDKKHEDQDAIAEMSQSNSEDRKSGRNRKRKYSENVCSGSEELME